MTGDLRSAVLITGTRYMNVEGMEPFESMTADYIKETGNHVLYRITPIFEGNNLLASGVLMEAKSVENKRKEVEMNKKMKKRGRCSAVVTSLVLICLFALAIGGCNSASKTPAPISVSTGSVESERAVSSSSESENTRTQAPTQIASTESSVTDTPTETPAPTQTQTRTAFDLSSIPAYSGSPYVEVNGNCPFFSAEELTTQSYEHYGDLDSLGRCTTATACIGKDLMPTEKRGDIGPVKPTGWHSVKYAGIDGNFLYNRCHLIGYQLTAENANEKNLITGTRYMNVDGMEPFESMTADYIKETGNHVLYRVTPVFEGDNLVAGDVLMEAESVEDNGAGILFCVYCYNVQPGVTIDYATGDSTGPEFTGSGAGMANTETTQAAQPETTRAADNAQTATAAYIGNSNSMKFHKPDCPSVAKMSESNKVEFSTRDEAIADGYQPCKQCNP